MGWIKMVLINRKCIAINSRSSLYQQVVQNVIEAVNCLAKTGDASSAQRIAVRLIHIEYRSGNADNFSATC